MNGCVVNSEILGAHVDQCIVSSTYLILFCGTRHYADHVGLFFTAKTFRERAVLGSCRLHLLRGLAT